MPEIPDEPSAEVPEGAALFPVIPAELGIHPMLLAILHAVVFLDSSDAHVVNDAAAVEALDGIATYLQRLQESDVKRVHEDMDCLIAFGRQEGWPDEVIHFFEEFLHDFGVGTGE